MHCTLCGKVTGDLSKTGLKIPGLCAQCFAAEFTAGFNEADDEIRYSNPHIYGDDVAGDAQRMWGKSPFSQFTDPPFQQRRSSKPPWPKPIIKWEYTADRKTGGWKVQDQVTEGWVFVPLEAVEALLGHPIAESLASKVTYTHEILTCAKRLLVLLIYGYVPRINAPKPLGYHDFNRKYDKTYRGFYGSIEI